MSGGPSAENLVLDHVGVAVRDLDAARETFTRLGFTLTGRSAHTGRATGNHCAMLGEGYLELIGLVHPERESDFPAMLERYAGVHIVAFGCGNAERAYPLLAAREPAVRPAELLERDAAFGPNGEETRRARFRNIHLEAGTYPEARFIFIEHATPEVLWQPHLLAHANGASAIAEVAICAGDVAETSGRLSRVLGVAAAGKGNGIATIDLPRGRIYVLDRAVVPKWSRGIDPPVVPSVVGFGVKVADLDATVRHLEQAGVPFERHPYPAIWVGPEHAEGTVLSFIQA